MLRFEGTAGPGGKRVLDAYATGSKFVTIGVAASAGSAFVNDSDPLPTPSGDPGYLGPAHPRGPFDRRPHPNSSLPVAPIDALLIGARPSFGTESVSGLSTGADGSVGTASAGAASVGAASTPPSEVGPFNRSPFLATHPAGHSLLSGGGAETVSPAPEVGPAPMPGGVDANVRSGTTARTGGDGPTILRVALVAAAMGAVMGACVAGIVGSLMRSPEGLGEQASIQGAGAESASPAMDIHSIIDRAQPSVVSVHTGDERNTTPFGSAGSGVVVSTDGLVLTNNHVVNAVTKISVVFADGTEHDAEFVGSSPDDDIALIRVLNGPATVPVALGSSADVRVGDEVVAIGNALDLGGSASVTRGIVSAKDRSIRNGPLFLRNLLQTDAAINPGNSGGPLFNQAGEVVGINTAIVSDAQNVGFAISIDVVKPLIDTLRDGKGKITPETAFLGVTTTSLRDVTGAVREQFRIKATTGAFIQEITDNSAASDARLELGDVITAVNGAPVRSSADLSAIVRSYSADGRIQLSVDRKGDAVEVGVTLRSRRETGG